ncbi:MAG: hypothetical protein ACR2JE_06720 [Acidobacteriaceae bacterium]
MASKDELVRFLDRHVFEPILRASPDRYGEHDRSLLEDVQKRTRTEQERFHKYPSAEKVREMYQDDLSSEKARKVNAHLKQLKLPILADVKDEFLKLAS